ncbi:hypothetical protein BJ138DRAFT_441680 [Hygrophoropsis aurantiaca]|uniref:Uncharacterized protein n=1 Tax=Hygrophoropsis aurantiaca TaxID=72124 RepID=A0ACB8A3X6_9AGAM|nr:hypothetical protein BJ138DRAFT_441680 [Hygrophoropsis aurantiaca]
MSTDFIDIPEGLIHPDRRGIVVDLKRRGGLSHLDMKSFSESSVVLLEFQCDGASGHGSGFFLNIPDLQDFELILTAGHNFIGPNGSETTNLKVSLTSGGQLLPLSVHDFWVCKAFREERKDVHDHAAILVKRISKAGSARGFGFSTKLGEKMDKYQNTHSGEVYVTGYRAQVPYTPTTSSGPFQYCFGDRHERMEYRVKTEQGISGSAVWFGYDGYPTAVAIHTNGPTRKGSGSRGCRLTPELLREVFKWIDRSTNSSAKLGRYQVKLRAQEGRAKPPPGTELPRLGLFMNFSDDFPFARVRLGSGTVFDVLPAEAMASSEKLYYALAVGAKWVLFNPKKKEAVMSNNLQDGCLFWISRQKKKGLGLVFDRAVDGEEWQLKMSGEMISDIDEDDMESSEVTLVKYPADAKLPFVLFAFEP